WAAFSTGMLSPDGKTIVGGTYDQNFKTWDVSTGKETAPPGQLAGAKAEHARFHDAKTLITIRPDTVTIWNWPAGTVRQSFHLPPPDKQPGDTRCQQAALSPDGKSLVTMAYRHMTREERGMRFASGADHVVDLWDATTGQRLRRLMRLT